MIELAKIKGIGPKTIDLFNKLGITTSDALISYYPYRYNFIKRSDLSMSNQNDDVIVDGVVENNPSVYHFNRRMDKMSFRINTGSMLLNAVIYNRGFLKSKLKPNTMITIFGKYDKLHNTIITSELRFGPLPEVEVIEPVYHTTYGLSSHQLKNYIDLGLKEQWQTINYIPNELVDKYNLQNKTESIKVVHNPIDANQLKLAQTTLKYEELFLFMLKINYLKANNPDKLGLPRDVDYKLVQTFIKTLPFELTTDQLSSIKDIYSDLVYPKRMNRLLQGDVGSGKTIVAIISLYINFLGGYQGALMAPTDILANQHYNNIKEIFKDYSIRVGLLTGKLKAAEKRVLIDQLKNGEIDIIIGTHALISDDVIYKNLGLVITDEQHRFGVSQRSNLKNKGHMPDILYMSATPIPRTYALTLYGDMDISNIKTMPKGRKDILTYLKKTTDITEILAMMYQELQSKHQVYVIAPLIEESDKIDLENIQDLEGKMQKAFGKLYKIAVLHGRMDNTEKEDIMTKFKHNEINILISTTVIEVGIDVPNATMIVIFDSFRFGLSTIHQLRGRVGRSELQSYCILISDKEAERLNILTVTNDGFKISEEDFRLRGSGDLFGVRQSGDMSFQIADIRQDFSLLLKAKEDSETYVNNQAYINSPTIKKILQQSNNLD